MTAFEYFLAKIPTGATIAVVIAFISTLVTQDMPLNIFSILFFLVTWATLTVIASAILMAIELIRDRL
ncbi:hypothetical protein CATRI_02510 [Corynebacterium atrinae]|uniref:Uncharacterized protein n=1 Tax=Corynebacterium testudinoris TaxID=136857 RepID=A0A0G3H5F3_9CORY|nr:MULTISPECIES: hypothetical protein [Corynebacterium]AKK07975.1 hypothetical protein CTEST_02600 [Corynebacterium testudinoris]MBX8995597.1 hypothetical protein [Corynebacterium testudinoris]WJY62607.1 hypothetical protein CATRI_02510 [Corynebacterium atrinae]